MISAVIVAGGKGRRMGFDINKVYMMLDGKEILARTLYAFEMCSVIDEIIVVTGADDIDRCRKIVERYGLKKVSHITEGGQERSNSVHNGLKLAKGEYVLIHDGARCLITIDEITKVAEAVKMHGAAALGVTVKDTLKSIDKDGVITGTVDRDFTVQIQTPQAFIRNEILSLHEKALSEGLVVTDDCSIFEHYGKKVKVVFGSYENIKLTTPVDITAGEHILQMRKEKGEII